MEGRGGITARVVGATGQAFYAGDQGAQMRRVSCRAAPCLTAIIREVGARIAITQAATRRASNSATPCARYIVVGRADDTVGVVWVHRDTRLVLRSSCRILIHGYIRALYTCVVKWAGQDICGRNRARAASCTDFATIPLFPYQGSHPNLQSDCAI